MPKIGDIIILSCQGKDFDKKMKGIVVNIKKNGWFIVRREDGYMINVRNSKSLLYTEKKELSREKTREVFNIVRDTLLNNENGDQEALHCGKFVRNLIEDYF